MICPSGIEEFLGFLMLVTTCSLFSGRLFLETKNCIVSSPVSNFDRVDILKQMCQVRGNQTKKLSKSLCFLFPVLRIS